MSNIMPWLIKTLRRSQTIDKTTGEKKQNKQKKIYGEISTS